MSFSYGRKPEVGKAFTGMNRGSFRVWQYNRVTENGHSGTLAPEPNHFGNKDMAFARVAELNDWQDFSKITVYTSNNQRFIDGYEMQPWEHVIVYDDKLIFFVWDTREITKVANNPFKNDGERKAFLKVANDNGKPLAMKGRWLFKSEVDKLSVNYKTKKEQ